MAFHDDVIEVPEDTLKRIKHRFPKAKADDTNKIALKIYKDLIKYCSHDRGTLQNWKLEHALHMAKAHYDKNKPKQRIADLNSLYDQFLAPGAKNKVTLEDAGLFIALAASHKKNWEDNPNVNKGVWKTVKTKVDSSLSQPTTNFQISPAGAKWNAQVDYENELFDDIDYELEQIKRGHSYINYQPQTGSGIGGIGGTNGKIREIGYRTGAIDPTMSILIGVMICICFVICVLLNIMSCVGGYVLAKFIGGNNKKNQNRQLENEYENV